MVYRPDVLDFLHNNAMQVAGLLTVVIGILTSFTHWTPAQVAAVSALGPGMGTFFAGMVINYNRNGNGKPTSGTDTTTATK